MVTPKNPCPIHPGLIVLQDSFMRTYSNTSSSYQKSSLTKCMDTISSGTILIGSILGFLSENCMYMYVHLRNASISNDTCIKYYPALKV